MQLILLQSETRVRVIITAEYLDKLSEMPNTIILGNMCYSGWSVGGERNLAERGKINVDYPIKTAFTNKNLISYYAYGFDDGTSAPADNNAP
jgi:hypothetical protein